MFGIGDFVRAAERGDGDAVRGAIREEAIVAPVASIIEVEFEGAAHVQDDDERREGRLGQALSVAARLPERPAHQLIVAAGVRRRSMIEAG